MTDSAQGRGLAWVPDACTLPTKEQPLRLAEFDDLFATTVDAAERIGAHHLRLTLRGPAELEAIVSDLAAREEGCCSFFTFTVAAPSPGLVTFDIEVPRAHVDALDALSVRAERLSGAR